MMKGKGGPAGGAQGPVAGGDDAGEAEEEKRKFSCVSTNLTIIFSKRGKETRSRKS